MNFIDGWRHCCQSANASGHTVLLTLLLALLINSRRRWRLIVLLLSQLIHVIMSDTVFTITLTHYLLCKQVALVVDFVCGPKASGLSA